MRCIVCGSLQREDAPLEIRARRKTDARLELGLSVFAIRVRQLVQRSVDKLDALFNARSEQMAGIRAIADFVSRRRTAARGEENNGKYDTHVILSWARVGHRPLLLVLRGDMLRGFTTRHLMKSN